MGSSAERRRRGAAAAQRGPDRRRLPFAEENSVDVWLARIRGGDHDFGQVL
ncbi:MAG: hypothetical protein IPN02_16450 [Candidatus Microthrix sp.]|uniref:Uncharacterized protein n=1 Tax=Candidatus Neomicrothrix subdominans TaxID=2954438 RepID=A0A936NEY4_9ACTN|nr:hypothetical protein [Candidatus Microthrix subdominans]